jgi:hypothetical protein
MSKTAKSDDSRVVKESYRVVEKTLTVDRNSGSGTYDNIGFFCNMKVCKILLLKT